MPIITVQTNRNISDQAMNDIVGGLSSITEGILRKNRDLITVRFVIDNKPCRWFVNGVAVNDEASIFELIIVITAGTNTEQEKSDWIGQAWGLMSSILGEARGPNYIAVNEICGDSWGYDGLTQNQRKVSQLI